MGQSQVHPSHVYTKQAQRKSGGIVANHVGYCSKMEAKYRYRNAFEDTGIAIPKEYWKDRDGKLLGLGNVAKKNEEGKWTIHKKSGQEEHNNPADYFNT